MLKLLAQIDYLFRETFLGLRRGGWMNWAAISVVTVLLFLFGIGLQTSWQFDSLLNQLGSQLEVSVYLQPESDGSIAFSEVQKFPQVKQIELISKEQAWETMVTELGISDIQGATEQLEGNPLVDELKVRVDRTENVAQVVSQLQQLEGVDEVLYVNDALRQLQKLRRGWNWASLTLTVVLMLTAIAVITTTLRLVIITRSREIEIMQLVGATKTWIYLPFLLQGVTFGLIGGIIAWGGIRGFGYGLSHFLAIQPEFIQFLTEGIKLSPNQMVLLPLIILGLGSFVGVSGSLFALGKLTD